MGCDGCMPADFRLQALSVKEGAHTDADGDVTQLLSSARVRWSHACVEKQRDWTSE